MQRHEREVTLKLNSRPLHLVYLVGNREDTQHGLMDNRKENRDCRTLTAS